LEREGVNRRRIITLLCVAASGVVGSGCASVDSEALRVSVASVSIIDASLLEQRYLLRVRLQNPSERELKLEGFVYDLVLNGRQFARGVSDQTVLVPRFGEQVIDLPAVGSTGGALRQILDLGSRTQIDYRLTGRASQGGGRLRLEGQGYIPIPKQLFDLAK
jgi:LEA14-like dessication related protein